MLSYLRPGRGCFGDLPGDGIIVSPSLPIVETLGIEGYNNNYALPLTVLAAVTIHTRLDACRHQRSRTQPAPTHWISHRYCPKLWSSDAGWGELHSGTGRHFLIHRCHRPRLESTGMRPRERYDNQRKVETN